MFKKFLIIIISLVLGMTSLYSQDPMEIYGKYLAFRGDTSFMEDLKTVEIKATQKQSGMSVKLHYIRNGEKVYFENEAMGQKTVIVYNGDSLWQSQGGQVQSVPSQYVEQYLPQLKQVEKLVFGSVGKDFEEEDETIEYSGEVEEDGKQAIVLNFINEENETETYHYFDKSDYRLYKIFGTLPGKDDQTVNMEIKFDNYTKIKSVDFKFPYLITMSVGEQSYSIEVEDVILNSDISDNKFSKP